MPGATRTAIGITGNTGAVDSRAIEVLPGVHELIRVTKPFKLASREMHAHDTVVRLPQGTFGGGGFTIIAGPCSVEDEATILRTAEWLMARGIRFLRAGAFKPRTSPYAFQGLGLEGLEILQARPREDRHRHRHRADGHRERRRRRGGGRRHPDRHAQHAELQPAADGSRGPASRCS